MPFSTRRPWYRALILGLLLNFQGAIAWSASTVPTSLSTQADLGRPVDLPLPIYPSTHLPIYSFPTDPPTLLALVRYNRRPARRPQWGAPRWSYGGAARGVGCEGSNSSPVVPLVPIDGNEVTESPLANTARTENNAEEAAFLGVTAVPLPSVLVYVPESTAYAIDMVITNEQRVDNNPDGTVVYQHQILLDQAPGIVRFDLAAPANITSVTQPLEVDRLYTWRISLICQAADIGGPAVAGLIERVSPDLDPVSHGQTSDPLAQVEADADAGLWHEALAGLADLYCENPADPTLQTDWQNLLLALDLTRVPQLSGKVQSQTIANAPLLWCGESTP